MRLWGKCQYEDLPGTSSVSLSFMMPSAHFGWRDFGRLDAFEERREDAALPRCTGRGDELDFCSSADIVVNFDQKCNSVGRDLWKFVLFELYRTLCETLLTCNSGSRDCRSKSKACKVESCMLEETHTDKVIFSSLRLVAPFEAYLSV